MIVRVVIDPGPGEAPFPRWRAAARRLLRAGIRPEAVEWADGSQGSLLGEENFAACPDEHDPSSMFRVPAEFVELAEIAGYHRDPGRWSLLYRILHRLTHGEPELLARAVDREVSELRARVQAVRRDEHKMHAFVRFHEVEGEQFVAWHRPDHSIVPLAAPFFARRFPAMRWTIVTPDAAAHWDTHELHFGPGAPRSAAPPPDELASLFLSYYRSVFNPARLNLKAMRAQMPKKHWPTLPEASAVAELVRAASSRAEAMLTPPRSDAAAWLPTTRELPVLREAATGCRACPHATCATRTVFGEGPRDASLMIVGEQPGEEEDRAGRPFVGPSGRLLDRLLGEAGIDRSQVYVTDAVKHFKYTERAGKRLHARPGATELTACRAWLDAEIEAVRPRVIVCLGSLAARSFVGPRFNAARYRGRVFRTPWAPAWLATFHPAAILRTSDASERARKLTALRDDLRLAAVQLSGGEVGEELRLEAG